MNKRCRDCALWKPDGKRGQSLKGKCQDMAIINITTNYDDGCIAFKNEYTRQKTESNEPR